MRPDDESNADLQARLARWSEVIGNVQLLTRTFASLTLTDPREIADTLNSLLRTCVGAQRGFALLEDGDDALQVASAQGVPDPAPLVAPDAQALWRQAMAERGAGMLPAADLARHWPARPDFLAADAAWVTIDIQEHAIGLLVVSGRLDGKRFSDEDREFLSAAAGIAAMAFANARARAAQQELIRKVELEAAEAARETKQKEAALIELDRKLAVIDQQRAEIRELSTPMLRVWDGVLALPIIGMMDAQRSVQIMERLLVEITAQRSKFVILDVTGVETVDTMTAGHFVKVIKSAEILVAQCVLTGIRPAIAQTLVQLGVDLGSVTTLATLQDGLRECIDLQQRSQGRRADEPGAAHAKRAGAAADERRR